MTALLLCPMSYQVTGETLHEWLGVAMTALVIAHQILGRRWYGALFKGKYHAYRFAATALNILLLTAFALTAFCGMSMSGHAVPFLYGMARVSFARQMHLSMSHWTFVRVGQNVGQQKNDNAKNQQESANFHRKSALSCILKNHSLLHETSEYQGSIFQQFQPDLTRFAKELLIPGSTK